MSRPPRVIPISEAPILITAAEAKAGDVWVGDTARITITGVEDAGDLDCIPWDGKRTARARLPHVRIHGAIYRDNARPFRSTWLVQSAQTMEVLRHA